MIIKSNDLFERVEKRGKLMFRKSGKGQAALEFLMTYGWAILVVLIVIGALAYFGVFNPSNLLPERCALQSGLECKDWFISATSKTLTLSVTNGMGEGIVIKGMSFSEPRTGVSCTYTPAES